MALCPHTNTAHFDDDCLAPDSDYLSGDLLMLARCDAILMIDGYERSFGAQVELLKARELGMPVLFSANELVFIPRDKRG